MPVRLVFGDIESRPVNIPVRFSATHRSTALTFPPDRHLVFVAKKGRPVSQCTHCRSLRKSRSQHVKCECRDKSHAKEDCPHLKALSEGTISMRLFSKSIKQY